jgi:hypothetical protein
MGWVRRKVRRKRSSAARRRVRAARCCAFLAGEPFLSVARMARRRSSFRTSRQVNSNPPITARELARVRRDGPAALRWQQRVGLAKAQQMCTGLLVSGLVPFAGLLLLGWQPAAMLLYLAIDVLAVLAGDGLKLALAMPALRRTHAEDHNAQSVLNIVGGLEDGTNTYVEHGSGMPPLGLFGIALACALVLVPVLGASLEALGLGTVRDALAAPWFREIAAGSVALHLLQSVFAAGAARRGGGDAVLYLDCGGVIGLAIGLLVLVWLPLSWGANGVIAMLVVMFLFRLGFGAFALYWMPRVTRALQRFLASPESPPRPA